MPALIGSSKTIQQDCTKLKKKMSDLMPHLNVTDDLVSVFNGDFGLKTKKDRDTASKQVRTSLAEKFGLKFNEKVLDEILGSVGEEAIQLEIQKVTEQDLEPMMECLGTDITSKLKYAISGLPILGVRITLTDVSMVGMMLVQLDDTAMWLPCNLTEDEEGTISKDECMKINRFVLNILGTMYPHNYAGTVTGPRGGTLSIGRVFVTTKKEGDAKVRKDMAGKCFIEY